MADDENVVRRPITVYVTEVIAEPPTMDHLHKTPSRIVHFELTPLDARKLRDLLDKRLRDGIRGGVRLAVKGRLVI